MKLEFAFELFFIHGQKKTMKFSVKIKQEECVILKMCKILFHNIHS